MSTTPTAVRRTTRRATRSATRRSAAVLVQARRRRADGAGPRRGPARGLRGRQDRHGQDPQGRQVLAAGRSRSDVRGRQVRDGARCSSRPSRPATRSTSRTSTVPRPARSRARRSRASRRPTTQTLIIKLDKATGGVLASGALGLLGTAPVPKEYAEKFDKETPTTYGENQVATGPYMIENDAVRQGDRLRAAEAHPPGPQPELGQEHGLQAGLPRRDRQPLRQ